MSKYNLVEDIMHIDEQVFGDVEEYDYEASRNEYFTMSIPELTTELESMQHLKRIA